MSVNSQIARAVHRALILGAIAAAGSTPLHAQDRSDSDAAAPSPALETVTVTGSRIVVPNQTSISPVTAISAEQITNTGKTRVEDVLNTLPQVFGSQNSGVSNGSNGTALVNLRNLDSKRTLVLIDGRRLGPGDPTGGFVRNTYGADMNMIPSQLIERVDVLTGGASSTYGADAVAGVINFVMNNHFEGVKVNASYGFNQHSNHNDAADSILANNTPVIHTPSSVDSGFAKDVNLIMGLNAPDGKGNATVYATFRTISPTLEGPYDYSGCTLNSGDSLKCGGSSTTAPPTSDGRFRQAFPDGSRGPNQTLNPDGSLSPFTAANNYNFGAVNYFQRPDERWTAGGFAHYEFNDHVDAYSEFMFMRDNTTSQIAPSGAFYGNYPFSSSGGLTVNCSNPFLNANELAQWCGGSTAGDATLLIGRRNIEGGPRQQSITHTDWRMVVGTRGEIADGWKYDTYAQQGEVQLTRSFRNDLSWSKIQNALLVKNVNGTPQCQAFIDGTDKTCVPWNIFTPGGVTPAAADYLSIPLLSTGSVTERVADANVTGDLGKYGIQSPLARSGLQVNFGVEWRQEKSDFLPDFAFQQGLGAGQGGKTLPIAGQYSVREGFMEANMPLLQDAPFAKSLSVETGYRYSSYSLDFKTNTYKFGVEYSPVDDVRFRGSFQRAVRVPNIGELYSPISVALDGVTDLCSGTTPSLTFAQCARQGVTAAQYGNSVDQNPAAQYNGLTGGNPNLKPETAITKSFGISLTPTFIEGLRIQVDYFDISIQNAIQNPNADFTMVLCSQTGNPALCNKIHRDDSGSIDGSPSNSYVEDTLINIGSLKTRGVDIDSSYKLNLDTWGRLGFQLTSTFTQKYITNPQPGASYDCAGYFGGICGAPLPKWRHNFTTSYTTPIKGLDFAATWRFLDAVKDDSNAPGLSFLKGTSSDNPSDQRMSSRSYLDLTASYQYDKYNVRVGVNNVLDKDPPIIGASVCPAGPCNGNTWPVIYDVMGRQLFMMVTAEF
ncbi:MAG: TonB-dependent receptor [Proteobacteria bacterium]|nr:TonB-dependent receptor [Pseudomonadota bacterium]